MGMHFGLIATKTTPEELISAFEETWPNLKIVEREGNFTEKESFLRWMEEKAKFVSARDWSKENPGTETYAIFQDGDWTALLDLNYILASGSEGLEKLSKRFNRVLSFIVETAGGTAVFQGYENGQQLRFINYCDGECEMTGNPLPEEQGIDMENYYMDETEELMQAFGLSHPESYPKLENIIAFSVEDQQDYGNEPTPAENMETEANVELTKAKPWWKFW